MAFIVGEILACRQMRGLSASGAAAVAAARQEQAPAPAQDSYEWIASCRGRLQAIQDALSQMRFHAEAAEAMGCLYYPRGMVPEHVEEAPPMAGPMTACSSAEAGPMTACSSADAKQRALERFERERPEGRPTLLRRVTTKDLAAAAAAGSEGGLATTASVTLVASMATPGRRARSEAAPLRKKAMDSPEPQPQQVPPDERPTLLRRASTRELEAAVTRRAASTPWRVRRVAAPPQSLIGEIVLYSNASSYEDLPLDMDPIVPAAPVHQAAPAPAPPPDDSSCLSARGRQGGRKKTVEFALALAETADLHYDGYGPLPGWGIPALTYEQALRLLEVAVNTPVPQDWPAAS